MSTRTVILDVDGTLVDSNRAHAYAWVDALSEAGYKPDFERVLRLIGMGGDKLLPLATAGLTEESAEGRRISARRAEIFKERYLPPLRPTPGARELVARLKRDGFLLGIASSAKRDELEALLEIVGAADLLSSSTSSDAVDESKPDPDVVHAVLDRLHAVAADAVMIGDTPYDIEAAHRADVRIIALRCGGWDDIHLRAADATYDHPADLLVHYAASPIASGGVVAIR